MLDIGYHHGNEMKKKSKQIILLIFCVLVINSCTETEYSCGLIATEIIELNQQVGTFDSTNFSNDQSSNFEEAAIKIQIADVIEKEKCDEEGFTPEPQLIESINITSSSIVMSGDVEYSAGQSLNGLFKLYRLQQVYSVSEFITAQNNDPVNIFGVSGDDIILQLLERPDATINQAFSVSFSFTDSEILNVESIIFKVDN